MGGNILKDNNLDMNFDISHREIGAYQSCTHKVAYHNAHTYLPKVMNHPLMSCISFVLLFMELVSQCINLRVVLILDPLEFKLLLRPVVQPLLLPNTKPPHKMTRISCMDVQELIKSLLRLSYYKNNYRITRTCISFSFANMFEKP